MKRLLPVLVAGLAAVGVFLYPAWKASAQAPSRLPTLAELKAVVEHPDAARALLKQDPNQYAWDLFLYAAWPAKERGVPDPAKKLGDPGQTVWESWKNTAETFLKDGAEPALWEKPEPIPSSPSGYKPVATDSGMGWQHLTGSTEVDGFPVQDRNKASILYEIRQNRQTYDYIRSKELYNVQGQIAYAKTKGALDFEPLATEAKASWRTIAANDPAGCTEKDYFTANAYFDGADPSNKHIAKDTHAGSAFLAGLTGLHLVPKINREWTWITFEQVNNLKCTDVKRRYPIDKAAAAANTKMRALLAGTKWANYELVGVQTAGVVGGKATLLANTQMETTFQTRSSCLTCHGIASVTADPDYRNKKGGELRKSWVDLKSSPPYYIGAVPPLTPWIGQDFVWSLDRAQFKK